MATKENLSEEDVQSLATIPTIEFGNLSLDKTQMEETFKKLIEEKSPSDLLSDVYKCQSDITTLVMAQILNVEALKIKLQLADAILEKIRRIQSDPLFMSVGEMEALSRQVDEQLEKPKFISDAIRELQSGKDFLSDKQIYLLEAEIETVKNRFPDFKCSVCESLCVMSVSAKVYGREIVCANNHWVEQKFRFNSRDDFLTCGSEMNSRPDDNGLSGIEGLSCLNFYLLKILELIPALELKLTNAVYVRDAIKYLTDQPGFLPETSVKSIEASTKYKLDSASKLNEVISNLEAGPNYLNEETVVKIRSELKNSLKVQSPLFEICKALF